MTYTYYEILMRNKAMKELAEQKKITINELSSGACEIRNHIEGDSAHVNSLVLDLSVEDPLVVKLEDGHNYKIDLENAFGLRYGNKNFEVSVARLAEFIVHVYKNGAKATRKGIVRATHIQTKDNNYRAKLVK